MISGNRHRGVPYFLVLALLAATGALREMLPSPADRAQREAALCYTPGAPLAQTAETALVAAALGHRGLAADIRYVRAVLMIGEAGRDYRGIHEATPWAHRILEEALILDPRFEAPLRLGAVVLSMHDRVSAALSRDFARRAGPRYTGVGAAWKPALWEGQAAYFAGDFSAAGAALERALKNGGPPWIEGLIAHAAAQSGGGPESLLATAAFLRAIAEEEKKPDWKASTLVKADMLEGLARLRQSAATWHRRHGRPPDRIEDIAPRGGLPRLPDGLAWKLSPDGDVVITGLLGAATREAPPHAAVRQE